MLRKFCAIAVFMLICMPIGGSTQVALGKIPVPALSAEWWFGPYELAILCGCLFVLSATLSLRRH